MASYDDEEEDRVPGATEDSITNTPAESSLPPVAQSIQPRPANQTFQSEGSDFAALPPPAGSSQLENPRELREPIVPKWLPPGTDENDLENIRLANEYDKQAAAYDRQQAQNQYNQQKKAANTQAREDSRVTGRQYDYDENGVAKPRVDPITGEQAVVERKHPVQYDEQGRPYQVTYNPGGRPGKSIVNPDAEAKIGRNPDDPTDTNLYKQNQNSPWEVIDPAKGILDPDNKVAVASAIHLHKKELADTANQISGQRLKIQQLRGNLGQPDLPDGGSDEAGSAPVTQAVMGSSGLTDKKRNELLAQREALSSPAPKPQASHKWFGSNAEANAQAEAKWNEDETARKAQLSQIENQLSTDDQIKDAKSKLLDAANRHQALKEMGPAGYLQEARRTAVGNFPGQIASLPPEDAQASLAKAQETLADADSSLSAESDALKKRLDDFQQRRKQGGTVAQIAELDKEGASLQADQQALQKKIEARNAQVQQIQAGTEAYNQARDKEKQAQRDQMRLDPVTAPAADQLDQLDSDYKQRSSMIQGLDPAIQDYAKDFLDADYKEKSSATINQGQQALMERYNQQQQDNSDLEKKARQRMDLVDSINASEATMAKNPGLSYGAFIPESQELIDKRKQLADIDASPDSADVQKKEANLRDDDKKRSFKDGKGYAVLHDGNVVINPKSMIPDGARPKGMDSWRDQIAKAVQAGDLTQEQGDKMAGKYAHQAAIFQEQFLSGAKQSNAYQSWLSSTGKTDSDDSALQFLKTSPDLVDKVTDTLRKTWQSFESGTGIPALAKFAGWASGNDFLTAMGMGVQEQEKANDPRLQNSTAGKLMSTVGSVSGFMASAGILKGASLALGATQKTAQVISMASVGGISAAEAANETYSMAIESGADKDSASAAAVLAGITNMAMLLPIGHYLQGFAAPIKNFAVQGIAKTAIEAANFAALNTGVTISNNAIAQRFIDKNRDLFEGVGMEAGGGLFAGAVLGAVSSVVGHVRLNSLKQKYNLPPAWDGKPEFLAAADQQIQALNGSTTAKDLKKQRDDLVAKFNHPDTTPDQKLAILQQVSDINAFQRLDPSNVAQENRTDLASALVKLSQGVGFQDLSETERASVGKAKTSAGVPFIEDHEGNTIITDTGKSWLSSVAPHAGEMIGLSGQAAKDAVTGPTNAAGNASAPANENTPPSQQPRPASNQEGQNKAPGSGDRKAPEAPLGEEAGDPAPLDESAPLADRKARAKTMWEGAKPGETFHSPDPFGENYVITISADQEGRRIATVTSPKGKAIEQFNLDTNENNLTQNNPLLFGSDMVRVGRTQPEALQSDKNSQATQPRSPEASRKEGDGNKEAQGPLTPQTKRGSMIAKILSSQGVDKEIADHYAGLKEGAYPEDITNDDLRGRIMADFEKDGGVFPKRLQVENTDPQYWKDSFPTETPENHQNYADQARANNEKRLSDAQAANRRMLDLRPEQPPAEKKPDLTEAASRVHQGNVEAALSKIRSSGIKINDKPLTEEHLDKIKSVLTTLEPEIAKWRDAFSKVVYSGKKKKSGGAIFRQAGALEINLGDILTNKHNLQTILENPSRARLLISEEAIHALGSKILSDRATASGRSKESVIASLDKNRASKVGETPSDSDRADAEAADLFNSLPKELQNYVEGIYSEKQGEHQPWQLGHEFLRMLAQHDIAIDNAGNIHDGKAIITEQTISKKVVDQIRNHLAALFSYFTKLSERLRGSGASEKTIRDIEEIRGQIRESIKSLRTQVDAKLLESYQKEYERKLSPEQAGGRMGSELRGVRRASSEAGDSGNLEKDAGNQGGGPDNGGLRELHGAKPGGDGGSGSEAESLRRRNAELEAQLAEKRAAEESRKERLDKATRIKSENTADKQKIAARIPEEARPQAEQILSQMHMGDPTYVLGANREKIPASYFAAPLELVQASHVGSDFRINPDYGGENTRPYHTDETEQNKVRQMALPGALDEDSIVSDVKSAADGPPQFALTIFNDKDGNPVVRLQAAGGNGRLQGVKLAEAADQQRLSDLWKSKEANFGLHEMPEGWMGGRFLGVYDLRDPEQAKKYQQLVDKLNPSQGVVQDTASRADIDAALKIPVAKLVDLPITMSPEEARGALMDLIKQSDALGLDRNLMAGLVKNPTQAQFYMQRLMLAAAFHSKPLSEFFTSSQISNGHATAVGLIKATAETALRLRDAGRGDIADALGRTLENIADYVNRGDKIGSAIRKAAEQTEMGSSGPVMNLIASAMEKKVAYFPMGKKGIKRVDSEETIAGFSGLMKDITSGVERFASEGEGDNLFGEKETAESTIQRAIAAHEAKIARETQPSGDLSSRRAQDPVRRMRQLLRKRSEEGLNRYETDELTGLEKSQGQHFMGFFEETKAPFSLESEQEKAPTAPTSPADQLSLLSRRADDSESKKAAEELKARMAPWMASNSQRGAVIQPIGGEEHKKALQSTIGALEKGEEGSFMRPDIGMVHIPLGSDGTEKKKYENGSGLNGIITKRMIAGEDPVAAIVGTINAAALGRVHEIYGPNGHERASIDYNGYRAILSLTHDGNDKSWVLTGYEIKEGGAKEVSRNLDRYAPADSYIRRKVVASSIEKLRQSLNDVNHDNGSPLLSRRSGTDENGFFSKMEEVLDGKIQGRVATADQIKALITKPDSGVKPDEVKWSGIIPAIDRLAEENGGKVPKEALMDFVNGAGKVQFEEKELSSPKANQAELDAQKIAEKYGFESEYDPHEEAYTFTDKEGDEVEFQDLPPKMQVELVENTNKLDREKSLPKYNRGDLVLPGGENYREVVLTMPPNGFSERLQNRKAIFDKYAGRLAELQQRINRNEGRAEAIAERDKLEAEREAEAEQSNGVIHTGETYTSSHFNDIPNYVAHMRLDERPDTSGRPGLFIEEIQSDRHQQGREKGYKEDRIKPTKKDAERLGFSVYKTKSNLGTDAYFIDGPSNSRDITNQGFESENDALAWVYEYIERKDSGTIPDAPFRKDWPLQMFKRALRDAVASGKEWIGWTAGIDQIKRYENSIRQSVDKITWEKSEDGTILINAIKGGQSTFSGRADAEGKFEKDHPQAAGMTLEEVVGKGMAEKIKDGPSSGTMTGKDLTIGGEGMKGFYDQILPKEIGKYVKQWGGRVEQGEVSVSPKTESLEVVDQNGQVIHTTNYDSDAWNVSRENQGSSVRQATTKPENTPIWKIDITPEMRQGVEEGQSLFSRKAGDDENQLDLFAQAKPELEKYSKALEREGITDPHAKQEAAIEDLGLSANQSLELFPHEEMPFNLEGQVVKKDAGSEKPKPLPEGPVKAPAAQGDSEQQNPATTEPKAPRDLENANQERVEALPDQALAQLAVETGQRPLTATKESILANTQPELLAKALDSIKAPAAKGIIGDFGEKIGGARKDMAVKTGSTGPRPVDERPAWERRYQIAKIEKSMREGENGRFAIFDMRQESRWGHKQIGNTFATEEEARRAIPLIAVSRNHNVYEDRTPEGKPAATFSIWRNVTDRKRVQVVKESFPSRDAAMQYMAEHAPQILETKTGWREELIEKPEKAVRSGAPRREGPATPEMFQEAFGFRGVEFGNWMRQEGDGKERQEVLNHAYDGLHDLADVLNVPPRALSLNGELALAFGARGQGLQGAKAHYEADYAVINLTKMKGAGSLAHEWFHALDHYMGRLDGKAKREMVQNEAGDRTFPVQRADSTFVSHGFKSNSEAREELRQSFKALMETIDKKAIEYKEDTEHAEKFVKSTRDQLAQRLQQIRSGLTQELTWAKRNNKPATEAQLARFDALADKLLDGDVKTEFRYDKDKPVRRGTFTFPGQRWSNDTLDAISDLFKEVRGRSGFNAQGSGIGNDLAGYLKRYEQRINLLKQANSGESKTKFTATSYKMESVKMDQGTVGDYWALPHELAARAFSAYVEDRIASRGDKSDYLSFGADNNLPGYRFWNVKPFPEGAEREAINKAFDAFFSTLDTKETDRGTALYSRKAGDAEHADLEARYKEGDESAKQAAQKLVDQKAESMGLIRAFHGTPTGGFTEFTPKDYGMMFTDSREVASDYTFHRNPWLSKSPNGKVYDTYLDIKNPLVIDAGPGVRHNNIPFPGEEWKPTVFGNIPKNAISIEDAAKRAFEMGHDGLIVKRVMDNVDPYDRKKSTVYVVKNANQAKSSEPFTYNESGELIPLSERFNTGSNSILYSRSAGEISEKNLEIYLTERGLDRKGLKEATRELSEQLKEIDRLRQEGGSYGELFDWKGGERLPASGGEMGASSKPGKAGDRKEADRDVPGKKNADILRLPQEANEVFARNDNKVSSLVASLISREIPSFNIAGKVLKGPADFAALMMPLRSPYFESLKVAFLDKDEKVIHSQILTAGTLDESIAHRRDLLIVLKDAKRKDPNVVSALIAHNHPSGNPSPSNADKQITKSVRSVLASAGITLKDHVITNGQTFYSFDKNDVLPLPKEDIAAWENVSRDKLKQITSSDYGSYIQELRQGVSPDTAHIVYFTTQFGISAVERVPNGTAWPTLRKALMDGIGREGPSGIALDLSGLSNRDARYLVDQAMQELSNVGVRLDDVTSSDVPSYADRGLIKQPETKAGSVYEEPSSPDQLQLDFDKAREDGQKTPAQRLAESKELIERIAGRFETMPGYDADEARQKARIAVANAAKSFDPSKGIPFDAYAGVAAKNAMRDLYGAETRHAQRFPTTLDATIGSDSQNNPVTRLEMTPDESSQQAPEETSRREARAMLDEASGALPERMKAAVNGALEGKTGQEIADELGISRQAVNQLQKAAYRRIREALEGKGVGDVNSLLSRAAGPEEPRGIDDLMGRLDELVDQARAEDKSGKPKQVGRPDLAHGADSPEHRAVDELYGETITRQTRDQWEQGGASIAKDPATRAKIEAKGYSGETLSGEETVAADLIAGQLRREMLANPSPENRTAFYRFWNAYRMTGSAAGRAMAARVDPTMTPQERYRSFLIDMISKPSAKFLKGIEGISDPKKRAALIDEETKRLLDKLEAAGIKPDDILKDRVTLRLADKRIINEFRSLLARKAGGDEESPRRTAFDMILANKSLDAISKVTGLKNEEIQKIKEDFIAKMREDHFAKFEAGAKADSASKVTGQKVSKEKAEAEFQKWMGRLGIVSDKEQGRPKFNIEDPAHVMRLASAIRDARGDAPMIDKIYELWVMGILSGMGTHVANVTGNLASATLNLTLQRGMESLVNLAVRDEKAARAGEFKWLLKGLMPGISKGYAMAAKAWSAEHDFFEHTVLGTPLETANLDKTGNTHASIAGAKGKFVRIPGRALLFADSMFKTALGQMEAGAMAYRIAKSEGLSGEGLARRIENLTKTRGEAIAENLSKANPSKESVQWFAERLAARDETLDPADLIADRGSEAWQMAREQAAYDLAKKQGWSEEAWKRAVESAREMTFQQDLKKTTEGGNFFEDLAAKLQDARRGNPLLGFFFPFVRTPYNIFRIGIRKSPLGSLNLATQAAKGLWAVKNGKLYTEGHQEAVRDLAEQAVAWGAMALLWSAAQGDEDDDSKQLLITGSHPRSMESTGLRALNERAYGGEYVVRIGGRDGVTIPYGRIEPIATVLGTTIDIIKGIKRNGTTQENMQALWGYMLDQANGKTFLAGASAISDMARGKSNPLEAAKKAFLQALVPNIIRSPLRALDDYVRDSRHAGAAYTMLPASDLAEKQINPYGEPVRKSGNPVLRMFFNTPIAADENIKASDRLLLNWNQKNPSDAWAPQPPRAVFKGRDGKDQEMTAEETAKFRLAAGQLAKAKLRGVVNPRNAENPRREDVEAVKKAFQEAGHEAKERIFTPAYLLRRKAASI